MESFVHKNEHLDLSKIQALHHKRTVAFVHHFVTTNVDFLNNFMTSCDQKLMMFERKLEKVNAAMVLLEAKLSSIPELNESPPIAVVETPSPATDNIPPKETEEAESMDRTDTIDLPQARPEYERFVKMVQVGVPLQAVKLKVSLEGLDPNILDEVLKQK